MPEPHPYLLGTHTEELERPRFQHTLCRPIAQAAWQRGWQIERLKPIPVLGDAVSMAGKWMERFVLVFGQQLQQLGHWNADDALEAQDEIARAHADPGCYWVGPTVLEVLARRP